ncbi:MAG: hypothetical protein DRJ64_01765 [Thermoprotei archaeon]|nr:MAG: hypothetical protein DRJ64_01765 [Thermoprotei archaeon]
MREIEPLSALGIINVTSNLEFYQTIIFEYLDRDRYYYALTENIEKLEEELYRLKVSMQQILNKEEVVINDKRVKPKVLGVDIGFKEEPEEPYLSYFIYFKGKLRRGEENYYENIYEELTVEYPFVAYWFFSPRFKILRVDASGDIQILGNNIIIIKVQEGEKISGYERIIFKG